jgi:hypothetical protein
MESLWNEEKMAPFKIISPHLSGGIEKEHENSQLE